MPLPQNVRSSSAQMPQQRTIQAGCIERNGGPSPSSGGTRYGAKGIGVVCAQTTKNQYVLPQYH